MSAHVPSAYQSSLLFSATVAIIILITIPVIIIIFMSCQKEQIIVDNKENHMHKLYICIICFIIYLLLFVCFNINYYFSLVNNLKNYHCLLNFDFSIDASFPKRRIFSSRSRRCLSFVLSPHLFSVYRKIRAPSSRFHRLPLPRLVHFRVSRRL